MIIFMTLDLPPMPKYDFLMQIPNTNMFSIHPSAYEHICTINANAMVQRGAVKFVGVCVRRHLKIHCTKIILQISYEKCCLLYKLMKRECDLKSSCLTLHSFIVFPMGSKDFGSHLKYFESTYSAQHSPLLYAHLKSQEF